jgi:ATP-dependent Lon protease
MEVIQLPATAEGSCRSRKLSARTPTHRSGLGAGECEIGDDALAAIIHDYTREAGVRNLG